ncbi:MAG: prepilin-type N-terminal cleavage/methylation domain-containing protein, partial [Proteobacteria bacterium]|nr:prepilin-type N-terminal cleavage/methylation domain-containing protein [Pseudomonadota bacterium]MBU1709565.1 prepilin-type N-terminal cleavage/methylation domain-containing protein [Pseudomonadota bacterium]
MIEFNKTHGFSKLLNARQGFSLVEMLVVLVIVGILAVQVVISFTSPVVPLKGDAFDLRSNMNMARGEAVKRNEQVLVEFFNNTDIPLVGDGNDDGYMICLDSLSTNTCIDEPAANIIKSVVFNDIVQFYGTLASGGPPFDGAGNNPPGGALGDGVSFVGNAFLMRSNGTTNQDGAVYLYVPDADPTKMRVAPFTV